MLKEEAMLKIKEQLKRLMTFSVDAETPVEKKMTSMKLKDGTEISYDDGSELGIGIEVYKIDVDGNQTPIEDGDYDLEDGRIITIKDGGVKVIAEAPVEAGAEETPITSEEPKGVEVEVVETAKGTDMEARISAMEENISSMMEAISTMGHMQEMSMSKIKAIESAPAASSIKVGKTTSNGNFNSNKLEIDELRELRNKYKLNTNGDYNFSAK